MLAIGIWVPMSGVALANHGSRVMDVNEPPLNDNEENPQPFVHPVGSTHTMTATVYTCSATTAGQDRDYFAGCTRSAAGSNAPITINWEIESGPNDTDGNTPTSPDRTCIIAAGEDNCSIGYSSSTAGTDRWRSWIADATADTAEGQNEQTHPGAGASSPPAGCSGAQQNALKDPPFEPDCTDVIDVQWTQGGAAVRLDCDDPNGPDTERETNRRGTGADSNETYTCTVTSNTNAPQSNLVVRGENEAGANDPDNSASYDTPDYNCSTDSEGRCTITVTSEGEAGTARICFWLANVGPGECQNETQEPTLEAVQSDGSDTGNDQWDQVEKTWEDPRTSSIDVEPEAATNPLGTTHTLTATVYNQFGEQQSGAITVYFEFFQGSPSDTDGNSPNTPDLRCEVQPNASSCQATYTQNTTLGTDVICGYLDQNRATTGVDGPSMLNTAGGTGNQAPTCDGEGINDPGDDPGTADPPGTIDDDEDVVQ